MNTSFDHASVASSITQILENFSIQELLVAIASCPEKDKWLKQREAFLPQLNKLYNDEEVKLFLGVTSRSARLSGSQQRELAQDQATRLASHRAYVSPAFNPIERIWPYLKGHGMAGYLTQSGVELGEKLFEELKILLNNTGRIRSVSTVKLP